MSSSFLDGERVAELWTAVKNYVTASGGVGDTVFLSRCPVGAIVIWSGTVNNIPSGWALCDGQDGRPDLRDRFVLGAGPNHAAGETGGAEKVTLTIDQMPSHKHDFGMTPSPKKVSENASWYGASLMMNSEDDTFTMETGGSQPHTNMPPYYALYYIIKIAPDETDGVTMEQVNQAIQEALGSAPSGGNTPTGGVIAWTGFVAPDGWALCDGKTYPIGTYPDLENLFIQQFGAVNKFGGDGTTTFAVPDLRDRFVLGAGSKHNVGETGGEETHTLGVSEMPQHDHDLYMESSGATIKRPLVMKNISFVANGVGGTYDGFIAPYGGNSPHNNMPPYYTLTYIIKV